MHGCGYNKDRLYIRNMHDWLATCATAGTHQDTSLGCDIHKLGCGLCSVNTQTPTVRLRTHFSPLNARDLSDRLQSARNFKIKEILCEHGSLIISICLFEIANTTANVYATDEKNPTRGHQKGWHSSFSCYAPGLGRVVEGPQVYPQTPDCPVASHAYPHHLIICLKNAITFEYTSK